MASSVQEAERFTGRVDDYKRFRPCYPREIVDLLTRDAALSASVWIADIAAGTGLFTSLLLENGNPVVAVEPNEQMRNACRALQADYSRLHVVDGTAENTGLPSGSVNFVTVAQAFHWFDPGACRREFVRILRTGGWCAIVFNQRSASGDSFHDAYERFTQRHNIDYGSVSKRYPDEAALRRFFFPNPMRFHTLPNPQSLTLEGLMGRTLSSSFMPNAGHPGFNAMRTDLEALFAAHQTGGRVQLDHKCFISYGQLS